MPIVESTNTQFQILRQDANTVFDVNEALNNKFSLTIEKFRHVKYKCQTVSLPGLNSTVLNQGYSTNNIKLLSNKLEYEDLTVTFIVDEDLKNYLEVYNWLLGMTAPETQQQMREFVSSQRNRRNTQGKLTYKDAESDGTLIIKTNHAIPIYRIKFYNMKPFAISGLQFQFTDNAEVITCDVSFALDRFEIESTT